ncbi:hypothetical protein F4703DRAFT_1841452 [Phycomyces blakesleeanus]
MVEFWFDKSYTKEIQDPNSVYCFLKLMFVFRKIFLQDSGLMPLCHPTLLPWKYVIFDDPVYK